MKASKIILCPIKRNKHLFNQLYRWEFKPGTIEHLCKSANISYIQELQILNHLKK